jgi:tetratricopeptide (TPR) repeat protein
MIRFLIFCTLITLLVLGFRLLNEYDYIITFSFLDYQIETTLFALAAGFLIIQFLMSAILRLAFVIFDLPKLIKDFWRKRRSKQVNQRLLTVFAEFLTSNRQRALNSFKSILSDLDPEAKEATNAILAELVEAKEAAIPYLKTLLDKRHYSFYAAKKLAEIYYHLGNYKEAESYGVRAFNENDADTELMLSLIRTYAKLKLWAKLVFIVSKLQRADAKILKTHAKEISGYYYCGAKAVIERGCDEEALQFLESALAIKPDHTKALRLYMELNINKKNTASIIKILTTAFALRPSFAIAEMYAKCSGETKANIYRNLANIAEPRAHLGTFLAISAHLGLENNLT